VKGLNEWKIEQEQFLDKVAFTAPLVAVNEYIMMSFQQHMS
jgi:hypothetical protein